MKVNDETTLEDILSGKAEEAADIADEIESEGTTEEDVEVKGETEETESPDDAPPASPAKPPEGFVPQAALLDERSKRQELQDRLAALERQFSQPKASDQEPEKPIDFLDDPDGWAKQLQDKFAQELSRVEYNASAKVLNVLEAAAKSRHSDYDEAAQAFAEVARGNIALQQEAASAPDPAEYVYQAGKRLQQLNSAGGDLDKLIQLEREKAIAEFLEKNPTPKQKAESVPTSLSTVTGASGKQEDVSPPPIGSLFNSY